MIRKSVPAALAVALFVTALPLATESHAARPPRLPTPPAGFEVRIVARVAGARELAMARNGDLFIGTAGPDVYLLPAAEASAAGDGAAEASAAGDGAAEASAAGDGPAAGARVFVHLGDTEAAGVTLAAGSLFVGTEHGVWRVPYRAGARAPSGPARALAAVRTGGGDDHVTTTVAISGQTLYAAVGSSCNNCVETDPTRATVQQMTLAGAGMHARAIRIRNAISLAVNPATGTLWAGVAGQDELAPGHPYEIFDPVGLHAGTPTYGWPTCYENRRAATIGADCTAVTVARVVMPAYATPTGAAFYPLRPAGRYAFPQPYRGGAFVAWHGSWHTPLVPPGVVFIPMRGDTPRAPVDWHDPRTQWTPFLGGFQIAGYGRIGRPTGIAVGPRGSLFVADDFAGVVYRIRPKT